jgi:predicted AlkP superfamily pyrophosphatase or phosphodiesterase
MSNSNSGEKMRKILLVFVDGLQFDTALERLSILKNANNSRVIPGIGFSNNIYPEMLCGKNPDEIGYFNEWSPVKGNTNILPFYLRWLDLFRPSLYINAGIRKIILRKIFKVDFSNIPFKYAHYFKPQGSHQFRDLIGGNILHEYDFKIFDAAEVKGKNFLQRDSFVINQLSENMDDENYLLSLVDLDSVSHVCGTKSKDFDQHLNFLDSKLALLFKQFTKINSENEIYLFSDHGMCDVTKLVDFDIERKFGRMNERKYLYFIDSTYLRVWVKDESLMEDFRDYLANQEFGELLTENQRSDFGLVSREFGDFIFRGKEGVMFVPNFYGGRANKAMHGYDSYLQSQNSIFSNITKRNTHLEMPKTSKGMYHFLKKIC